MVGQCVLVVTPLARAYRSPECFSPLCEDADYPAKLAESFNSVTGRASAFTGEDETSDEEDSSANSSTSFASASENSFTMGIIIPFCQTAREQMDNDNVPFAMYPDPDAETDFIAEVTDYVTQSAEVDFNNFIEEMRTAVAHRGGAA